MKQVLYLFPFLFLPGYGIYSANSTPVEKSEQLQSAIENHLYALMWRSQDGSRLSKEALNLFTAWCKKPERVKPDGSSACELLINRGLTGPKVFAIGRELLALNQEKP